MATQVVAVEKPEVNHHQRKVIAQARRLAKHYGMRISKSRKGLSWLNYGQYRIDHIQIVAGSRFNLNADECLDFLCKLVELKVKLELR
jgi:hypothetical protein